MIRVFLVFLSILLSASPIFAQGSLVNEQSVEDVQILESIKTNTGANGFQENKGQMKNASGDPVDFVLFKMQTSTIDFYITETGLTYIFREFEEEEKEEKEQGADEEKDEKVPPMEWARIDLILENATIIRENIIKESPLKQSTENFFYGHCPDGIYDVKRYEKITVKNVYPHIDWVFYNGSENGYKYDFVLNPGANLTDIQLIYRSAEEVEVDAAGSLKIENPIGNLVESAPSSFLDGESVASRYIVSESEVNALDGFDTRVTFGLDKNTEIQFPLEKAKLIIDPEIVWCTLYGGLYFEGTMSIDSDSQNNLFAVGYVGSTDFPVVDNSSYFQGAFAGGYSDLLLLKIDPLGNILWATYYGGDDTDIGMSVVTSNDDVFVTGWTESADLPVFDGGGYYQPVFEGFVESFVLKFDNDGNRLWATYYGGTFGDFAESISSDNNGDIYVVGRSASSDFPLLDAGTYFQDSPAGYDAFILKFDPLGNRLWATFFGGGSADIATSLASDSDNSIFVVGTTISNDLDVLDAGTYYQPVKDGFSSAFIVKFDEFGNQIWTTYYGGDYDDEAVAVAVDLNDQVIVAGGTHSTDLPLLDAGGYFQATRDPIDVYNKDCFVLKFDNDGDLIWGTYFGGEDAETTDSDNLIAIDGCNNVFVSFHTKSHNAPTLSFCEGGYFRDTTSGGGGDQFLVKFNEETELLGATYIGGDKNDFRSAMTISPNGDLIMTGEWARPELGPGVFPNLTYPFYDSGTYFDNIANGSDDVFFLRFGGDESVLVETKSDSCSNGGGQIIISFEEDNACEKTIKLSPTDEVFTVTDSVFTIDSLVAGWYGLEIYSACDTVMFDSLLIEELFYGFDFDLGNDTSFCGDFSFIIDPDFEGDSYTWQDGSNLSTFEATEYGWYWVTVQNGVGCTRTDSIEITEGDLDAEIIFNNPSCYGFSDGSVQVLLLGSFEDLTFEITDALGDLRNEGNSNAANALATGWYYISVTSSDGCFYEDSIFLEEPPMIDVDLTITNTICYQDSTGIVVVDSVYNAQGDLSNISYFWTPNPCGLGGVGADSCDHFNAGEYTLTINDDNGCSELFDFVVTEPDPLIFVELGYQPAQCRLFHYQNGNGYVFAAGTGGVPDYSYLWENLETSETSVNSTWGGLNPGSYRISVTDENGCILTEIIQLDSVNPIAEFEINSAQLNSDYAGTELVEATFINQSLYFSDTNDPESDTLFSWNLNYDFADWQHTDSYFFQPDTAYVGEAIYQVCLATRNKNGCTDTTCKDIIVHVKPEFVAPNIFTPQGNGANDLFTFEFRTIGMETFHCSILNRWGVLVAELNHITDGWDGNSLKGNPCSNGVYFYVYEAVSTNGTAFNGQGTVQLVRGD